MAARQRLTAPLIGAVAGALACVLACAVPVTVGAQTSISGFVRDSLASKALDGATIQLVPSATPWAAGRTVRADSIGRFRIDSVMPGQYLFGFQHPRLDSLGLDAVTRTIEVTAGLRIMRADLAVPSGRTFVTTLCGARADSSGAVIGRVFNADDAVPITGGSVVVRWAQMRVGVGGVQRAQMQVTAPFGTDGRYVACGMPTDVGVLVQARAGSGEALGRAGISGEIELTFAPKVPLLHRDLLMATSAPESVAAQQPATSGTAGSGTPRSLAARTGTARLAGRVLSGDGKPVMGARVSIQDTELTFVTDSAGTFRGTGLPTGTRTVEIIAIGYPPTRAATDLRPNRDNTITISLGAKITTLGEVNVVAAPDRAGFNKRRAQGQGYFLDASTIEARGAQNVGMALTTAPTLRGNGFDTSNPTRPIISGRSNCRPSAYLDGMPMRDGLGGIDDVLSIRLVGGIEVYADPSSAPPQFHGNGNCAVILVWTKSYVK